MLACGNVSARCYDDGLMALTNLLLMTACQLFCFQCLMSQLTTEKDRYAEFKS